jgi:hypothetical protein
MELLVASSATAQPRAQSTPCVVSTTGASTAREPRLRPVDEAERRPDFLEFRRRLQDAVVRRDAAAILGIVHPNVRVSFGGANGIEAFRKEHLEKRDSDFWEEFAKILRLGGRFRMEGSFDAPYTFSAWPGDLDSFECLVVVGTRVRVRAAPGLNARILTALDFAIVRALPPEGEPTPGGDASNWQTDESATWHHSTCAVRSTIEPCSKSRMVDGG